MAEEKTPWRTIRVETPLGILTIPFRGDLLDVNGDFDSLQDLLSYLGTRR